MVDECKCKYCGQVTKRPVIFAPTPQRIFNYIWDHPWCTVKDIVKAIYGQDAGRDSTNVHICRIRSGLKSTPYFLDTSFLNGSYRNRERTYAIFPKPIKINNLTAGPANVSP